MPAYAQALEGTHGEGALERFDQSAKPHMAAFVANAQTIYKNFMRQLVV